MQLRRKKLSLQVHGIFSLLLSGTLVLAACSSASQPSAPPASLQVEEVPGSESKRLTLTQDAVDRLKVRVEQVVERPLALKRPGEVLYLPELGGQVNASESGRVLPPASGQLPKPGDPVSQGQALMRLTLASGQETEVRSPVNGTFIRLRAGQGQTVAPGQALFEVADLSRVWVWVPLSPSDLGRVALDRPSTVMRSGGASLQAQPAPVPVSLAGVAIFYLVDTPGHGLFPAQKLTVEMADAAPSRRTIPYSAVVYDAVGNSWVYTSNQSNVFQRAAVKVDRVEGDLAVLAEGPDAGTFVAVAGAAEMFSAEGGVGLNLPRSQAQP